MPKDKIQDNQLAINLLKQLGIKNPGQHQIALIAALTGHIMVKKKIYFNQMLSKRECECLFWAAHGKSSVQIANILGLKPSTIHWYKREIIQKLNCQNITQAVFEGMRFDIFNNN